MRVHRLVHGDVAHLAAGTLDELYLHVVPIVLGAGGAAARKRRRSYAEAG